MQPRHILSLAALIPLVWTGSALASKPVWPDVVVQLHGIGKAYIIDTKTDTVAATLETCKGGTLGSVTPDAKKLYVSCAGEDQKEVLVIDLTGRSVVKRVETGNRPKHGLVSPNGKWVGVDHWGLTESKLRVSFLDTSNDNIVKTLDLDVKGSPKGVTSMHNAWSLDSRYFFSLDRVDNRLVVVDTSNWSVKTLNVPSAPHYPVPSPDGKELWLVHEGNIKPGFQGPNGTRLVPGQIPEGNVMPGVIVYDLTRPDMPVITRIDMPIVGEEVVEAHHGNFTQDGKLFMILNRGPGSDSRGRELAFIDAKTKKVVHRLSTASNGVGHTYNSPDGRYAVVTNYGNNIISIVDVKKMATVQDLIIGKGRMGHIAFTRDGKSGYVSNAGDGNVYKLDMDKLAVVKTIETGAGTAGGGQVLNVWTNIFEELPR